MILLKFTRFNCKANANVILFFVKNAGLGLLVEKIYNILMGEVSISKRLFEG